MNCAICVYSFTFVPKKISFIRQLCHSNSANSGKLNRISRKVPQRIRLLGKPRNRENYRS